MCRYGIYLLLILLIDSAFYSHYQFCLILNQFMDFVIEFNTLLTDIVHSYYQCLTDCMNHVSFLKSLRSTIVQICSRNSASKSRIEINTVNVEQQVGSYDCGLLAISYSVKLCLNNNPANLQFDESTMRAHYNACLADRRFTSFKKIARDAVLNYQLHRFNQGK